MKRLGVLLFIVLALFSVTSMSVSAYTLTGRAVSLGKGDVVDEDTFLIADKVEVNGVVNGDVYVVSGTSEINGKINGNLYVTGGVVKVNGEVSEDVVVIGGVLTINEAKIGGGITLVGGSVTTSSGMEASSMVFVSAISDLDGKISGGIHGVGDTVVISAKTSNNVEVRANKLSLSNNAKIDGDLIYASPVKPLISEQATVAGRMISKSSSLPWAENNVKDVVLKIKGGFVVLAFISSLLIGWLMLFLFGKKMDELSESVSEDMLDVGLWGLVVMIVLPFVVILLMLSIVGLPLAFLLLGSYLAALYVSNVVVANLIGKYIAKSLNLSNASKYLTFTLGLLILVVAYKIPVFGSIIRLLTVVVGTGAIFSALFTTYKRGHSGTGLLGERLRSTRNSVEKTAKEREPVTFE